MDRKLTNLLKIESVARTKIKVTVKLRRKILLLQHSDTIMFCQGFSFNGVISYPQIVLSAKQRAPSQELKDAPPVFNSIVGQCRITGMEKIHIMKIGVVFPQIEFPADPVAIRDYAQAAEEPGFTHIVAYDHVLGANPDRPGGWQGPPGGLSTDRGETLP